jgi:gliding motility-associated-like protein
MLAVSATTVIPVSCTGSHDGSINVTVTGGTAPYIYSWTGPGVFTASTEDLSGLAPGTYTLVVTDSYNCEKSLQAVITEPEFLTISATGSIQVSCHNVNDGVITATAEGGTGSYTYSLNGGPVQSSNIFTGLASGSYNITVFDANSCSATTETIINIINPPLLEVSAVGSSQVLCHNSNDGVITVTASGGTGTYSYSLNGGIIQSSNVFSGLPADTYLVTVYDTNNCSANAPAVVISNPPLLTLAATASTQVSCHNGSDGVITAFATGGTGSYSYSLNGGPIQSSNVFNGLPAGTYNLTVYDENNCSATNSTIIRIGNPPLLTVTASGSSQVSCHNSSDGIITATATGGTGAYSYSLNGGPTQSSNVFSGLPAGSYIVIVYDANGCSAMAEPQIIISNPPLLTVTAEGNNQVSCHDASDGVITATAIGGTGAYSYSLNGGPGQSSNVFSGLSAGNYIVTVHDANGCFAEAHPAIIITNPPLLTATAEGSSQVSCHDVSDGVITVTAAGGTGAYSYSLNGGPIQTSNIFSGMPAGTYLVTVYDAKGCSAIAELQIVIVNPDELTLTAEGYSQVSCHDASDGIITATATGGTGVYSYSLNGGPEQSSNVFSDLSSGTYVIVVFDANNCSASTESPLIITNPDLLTIDASLTSQVSCHDASDGVITVTATGGTGAYSYSINSGPFQSSNVFTGLPGGTYVVTVIDENKCSATSPEMIIMNPELLTIDASVSSQVLCHDESNGVITATATGGTGTYSYYINGGPLQSSNVFTGLPGGTYVVTVVDENKCSATSPAMIITNPDLLTIDASVTSQVLCHDESNGVITVSAEGGTGVFSYSINEGQSQSSNVFSGLSSGTYLITVFDANNCSVTSDEITLSNPELLTASISITSEVSCYNATDGMITATSSGGTGSYSYSLNDGPPQESGVFSGLPAGSYVLTSIDNNGCIAEVQFELSQPDQIIIELLSAADADCTGNENGSINVAASGGESPYTYSWSNGSVSPQIVGLSAGNYTVTVTDSRGCQNDFTRLINPGNVEEQLVIVNAFTPNSDGNNDLWVIKNIELYPDNSLVIVNRWGNEVYSVKDYQNNWDGSQLVEGTYFYILKVTMCEVQRTFTGYVTILR